MISSEVQRTLVKSPPELWAELGDPVSLARHLEALGEIRITRAEPEQRVDWEADGTSGTVLMKPTGWGTKVTLSVTSELAHSETQSGAAVEDDTQAPEAEPPSADAEAAAQPDVKPEMSNKPAAESPTAAEESPTTESIAVEAPELENESVAARAPETEPHRGFFARLFARRRQRSPEPPAIAPAEPTDVSEPTEAIASEEQPAADAAEATEQATDVSAELRAAEDVAGEEATAVLTAVLDRLGAAHHRPFSRS